jgi:hypothetical protein
MISTDATWPNNLEWVKMPYVGDRPNEYHLTYDLAAGWETAGDDCGWQSGVPATFTDAMRIADVSLRPNNPERKGAHPEWSGFDIWGPSGENGRIILKYLKVGDYIIQKTTIPLTAGTAVNVNLADKLQSGATLVSIATPPVGIPAGISVASNGAVTGTPTAAITATSVQMEVTYKLAGDTENRVTMERLYFAPASAQGIGDVKIIDPVVAERYYNLQGIPVKVETGRVPQIYIVKQTLQSGAEKTVKRIF